MGSIVVTAVGAKARRPSRDSGGNRGQGSKWIRPEKRQRIYRRDGWRCVWCRRSASIHEGAARVSLTLDHVTPRELGGTNHESNLVTSCVKCNTRRRKLGLLAWVWTKREPHAVLERVAAAVEKPLPPRAA